MAKVGRRLPFHMTLRRGWTRIGGLAVVVVAILAVVGSGGAAAHQGDGAGWGDHMGDGHWADHMGDGGWGHMGDAGWWGSGWGLVGLLWLLIPLAALVGIVSWLGIGRDSTVRARSELRVAFARGDIDEEEYEARRRRLLDP